MEEYTVEPTSRDSAHCDPVVLRQSDTVRLVFLPLLINSVHGADQSVNGDFVYQRKRRKAEWDDVRGISLSSLKAGEGFTLHLSADEILALHGAVGGLYALHAEGGVPKRTTVYVKTDVHNTGSVEATAEGLRDLLEASRSAGVEVAADMVRHLVETGKPAEFVGHLKRLGVADLARLGALSGLAALRRALDLWDGERGNCDEEFWQVHLAEHAFVFSQILSSPVVVLQQKAYVGGTTYDRTGAHFVDFLMANERTKNVALIEIKTPCTRLLGKLYRNGVYPPSKELSGAVAQALTYRASLLDEWSGLKLDREGAIACDPACLVVAGDTAGLDTPEKRRSFELYRRALSGVQIVTYDELFARVATLATILEEGASGTSEATVSSSVEQEP